MARGERHRARDVALLELTAEALQLEVEATRKKRAPALERALGVRLATVHQRPPHVPLGGPGERDQAGDGRRRQPVALEPRHATLLALEVGARDEPRQVAVAVLALTKEREAARLAPLALFAHREVDPHDGLDAAGQGLAIELHHREQVVLIGDGDGRHVRGGHGRDQLRHPHDAVAEGVLAVQAQVNEARGHRRCCWQGGLPHGTERAAVQR